MGNTEAYVLVLQLVSILSITASVLTIWNTIFLHYFNRSNQSISNIPISVSIVFICLGDAIGNGPYLTQSRPETGSINCDVEGFCNMSGYSITWTWTLYISYILYSLCVLEKMPQNFKVDALLTLGIPLLFATIQLSAFGFARQEDALYDVCIFARHYTGEIVYHYLTYYGMLMTCFVAMIYMRYQQYLLEKKNDYRINSPLFITCKTMLRHYPWVLALCWIPRFTILNIIETPAWVRVFVDCLKISHGLFVPIVYFYYSEQARKGLFSSLNPFVWLAIWRDDKEALALLGPDAGTFNEEFSMSIFKTSDVSDRPTAGSKFEAEGQGGSNDVA